MFNKYYQDELTFLREMGKEFARAHPSAAQCLADRGSDPDVERLLEGFAFLTGRIRQKLDDEFPELTHALMNLLWPHYLRPIPSMALVEFTPIPGAVRDRQRIARGVELASAPVEGTSCRFQTCSPVDLYPFVLEDARLEGVSGGRVAARLRFTLSPGSTVAQAKVDAIRLHWFGEPAYLLYLWMCRHVSHVVARPIVHGKPGPEVTLADAVIAPIGFSREEALLPYPAASFDGYRLLQEYFAFPEKFLGVEISRLEALSRLPAGEAFELDVVFARPPAASLRITRDHVRLYCTPVVNLLTCDSDPVRVSHDRVEYRLRPAGFNPSHAEIYSVDRAAGWARGTAQEREYEPFYSFKHGLGPSGRQTVYYQTRLSPAVVGDGTEMGVSFVDFEQATVMPPTETVVFDLTCTNRALAGMLRVGDIQTPTERSPEYARFRNISKVTPAVRPPLGGDLYWRLISHLSLNYVSLTGVPALRGILELYNFQAFYDRQAARANERRLEGIAEITSEAEDRLYRGIPVRGTQTRLDLIEDHFAGEGDMFLFASVLNEFFSLYASLNSFNRLSVRGVKEGEVYRWPARAGQQIVI